MKNQGILFWLQFCNANKFQGGGGNAPPLDEKGDSFAPGWKPYICLSVGICSTLFLDNSSRESKEHVSAFIEFYHVIEPRHRKESGDCA